MNPYSAEAPVVVLPVAGDAPEQDALGERGDMRDVSARTSLCLRRVAIFGAAAVSVLSAAALVVSRPSPSTDEARSKGSRADVPAALWTVREAESIATVRGLPVHVRGCRGLGSSHRDHAALRYRRFACTAGTGLDWESFDSVAVTYVLVPQGAYAGGCSAYALRDVRFVGGSGIP